MWSLSVLDSFSKYLFVLYSPFSRPCQMRPRDEMKQGDWRRPWGSLRLLWESLERMRCQTARQITRMAARCVTLRTESVQSVEAPNDSKSRASLAGLARLRYATQNGVQLDTEELFISGTFYVIFSGSSWPRVNWNPTKWNYKKRKTARCILLWSKADLLPFD